MHYSSRVIGRFLVKSVFIIALLSTFVAAKAGAQQNTGFVYMNFTNLNSEDQREQYEELIGSLQSVASFTYRDTVNMTPSFGSAQNANLIRMQLTDVTSGAGPTIQLWFTADNLYLRGFTNVNGQTWYFNEGQGGYSLASAFYSAFGQGGGPGGNMAQLPF